jgi:branched-chain amino acid transport system permease protein
VVSLVTMLLLTLMITRSRIGKSLRAAADNPTAANLYGYRRRPRAPHCLRARHRHHRDSRAACSPPTIHFIPLSASNTSSSCMPASCSAAWAASVGAFWGGMTIGLVQQMSTLILPTQLQNAAIFVVFS